MAAYQSKMNTTAAVAVVRPGPDKDRRGNNDWTRHNATCVGANFNCQGVRPCTGRHGAGLSCRLCVSGYTAPVFPRKVQRIYTDDNDGWQTIHRNTRRWKGNADV